MRRNVGLNESRAYTDKRNRICNALSNADLKPYLPEGAYYVLANITNLPGKNSKERAMYLLRQTGVASVPGKGDGSIFAPVEQLDSVKAKIEERGGATFSGFLKVKMKGER